MTGGPQPNDDVLATAAAVLAALDGDEPGEVRLLLHPYLHWTLPDGTTLRGRNHVLAHLEGASPTGPPTAIELRDGQVYRWTEPD